MARRSVTEPAAVHVRWGMIGDLTDDHAAMLDRPERARFGRLHRAGDRGRFTLGAVLLRTLVADLDGTEPQLVTLDRTCARCGAQHGPVRASDRPWHCSVSHSGPFAVAAVVADAAAATVGIDLETTCPPDWHELLRDVLAPGEAAPADEDEFLTLWVRKEAVVKATREGLTRPMSSVDLRAPTDGLHVVDLDAGPLVATGSVTRARAAVAVDGDAPVELRRAAI
jgi:4'-phosphopantetheinyl transferase